MTDRVELLRKFGKIEPWLAERIYAMNLSQWRRFYDLCEAGTPLPLVFEDTMPRGHNDMVSNPFSSPPQYKADYMRKWGSGS
jgi:hypothetical protein